MSADITEAAAAAAASAATTTRFTEAIPLSLSSMAHTALPLEDGLLDGLKTTIQHTLWSSLSYARAAFGQNYSPVDLSTSPEAWKPNKIDPSSLGPEDAIPANLLKQHGFKHSYQRTALIYLIPAMKQEEEASKTEAASDDDNWTDDLAALARISFLYAATDEMTPEELDAAEHENEEAALAKANKKKKKGACCNKRSADQISDEDSGPPAPKHIILYRATIEYRSLPATGNQTAVRAEELSMLSFGGSLVDDDVKYGALASLYDDNAKYVLEILGVRGKKYRLDLMDATLSDGTVPTLPSRNPIAPIVDNQRRQATRRRGSIAVKVNRNSHSGAGAVIPNDPFVKRLCVSVFDHEAKTPNLSEEEKKNASNSGAKNPSFALTTMRLCLEGGLRVPHLLNANDLPASNFYPYQIQKAFLSLRSAKLPPATSGKKKEKQACSETAQPEIIMGMPSGHRILLNPSEAGKIYIHGRYVCTWGKDPRIGGAMGCCALFGMDLHSVPYWHGRIVDYDQLMVTYATLWMELLTDAKLVEKNVGGRLLSRLITGHDPIDEDEDDDSDSDDDASDDDDDDDSESSDEEEEEQTMRHNTDTSCLESQVMSSGKCDPVGISAKALATTFQKEFGEEGYPCLTQEIDWVKDRLPGRVPVAVPQRLIDILRRGGYFDIKRTSEEVWFSESRPATEDTYEEVLVKRTCELLMEAKCSDVQPSSIVFGTISVKDAVHKKGLVRNNRLLRQYHVNDALLKLNLQQIAAGEEAIDEDEDEDTEKKEESEEEKAKRIEGLAKILGMHIAREHPDGNILMRFMLQHMVNV